GHRLQAEHGGGIADGETLAVDCAYGDRQLFWVDPGQLGDVVGYCSGPDRNQFGVHPVDVTGQGGEIRDRQVALDRAPDQAAIVLRQRLELLEADLPGGAIGRLQAGQGLGDTRVVGLQAGALQAGEHLPVRDPAVLARVERVEQLAVDHIRADRSGWLAGRSGRGHLGHRVTPYLLLVAAASWRSD